MLTSPLRYPGGKAKLFEYFTAIIRDNNLYDSTYCEPYAGGAGLALKLLSGGFVRRVALNDIDPSIFAFWRSVIDTPVQFCRLIETTPVTIEEWRCQKAVWQEQDSSNLLKLGFATFFLNRTNRSGIIEGAGPIGGYQQAGTWRLDVRFNKPQLIAQIQALAAFRDQITVSNLDAIAFVKECFSQSDTFSYLDPPYYVKGSKLYRNFYQHDDHCQIRTLLDAHRSAKWVVSYDDVTEIRKIYSAFAPISYSLSYTAGTKSNGNEVIYFSDSVRAPAFPGFTKSAA